jgi:hypothetical protein
MADSQQKQSSTSNKNDLRIIRASGSLHVNPQNGPENLVHPNPTTYFSSEGIGAYFDLEIVDKAEFNTLVLGFYRGKERKTKFTVTKTDNFTEFEPVQPHQFVSSGDTDDPQKFHFKEVNAKGVRVSFDGNLDNGHVNHVGVIDPLFIQSQQQLGNVHLAKSLGQKTPINANMGANTSAIQLNNAGRAANKGIGKDYGVNCQYFSITSAALLNEELEESESEKLDKILKEIEELENKEDTCKDCKCIRCGNKLEKGVCPRCGITGNYNHITYNYISENFPVSYDVTNNSFVKSDVHVVDTTPSKSVPASLHSGSNNTTTLIDKPANSGNVSVEKRNEDEISKAEQQKINYSSSSSVSQKDKDNQFSKTEDNNLFRKEGDSEHNFYSKLGQDNKQNSKEGSKSTPENISTGNSKDGNSKDKIVTTTQTTTEAADKESTDLTLSNSKDKNNKKQQNK